MFTDNLKVQIGKELQKLRIDKDITIKELARLSGVNETTIGRYENGKGNDLNILGKMLSVYDTNFDIFFEKCYASMHD